MATAMAVVTAIGTIAQGYASYQEGKYQQKLADANADILRNNADRTRLETSINEEKMRRENRQKIAKNVAASVEQGMGNSNTTLGLIGQQTATLEQNALNLRYEGLSKAEYLDQQANYMNYQGRMYKAQGKNAFRLSFLNAGVKGMNTYASMGGRFPDSSSTSGGYYSLGGQKYYAQSL